MFPVISGDCRRGGDGERSIDASERDEGGAGRACERFGRERIRGSVPPGVGVNGSSIFGDGCRMLGTGQAQYMCVDMIFVCDMSDSIVCGMRYDRLDDQLVMACLSKLSARTSTSRVFG
jgi:hypothetical protein